MRALVAQLIISKDSELASLREASERGSEYAASQSEIEAARGLHFAAVAGFLCFKEVRISALPEVITAATVHIALVLIASNLLNFVFSVFPSSP
jgi:hypothetical protein